jgi:hypothetical protein
MSVRRERDKGEMSVRRERGKNDRVHVDRHSNPYCLKTIRKKSTPISDKEKIEATVAAFERVSLVLRMIQLILANNGAILLQERDGFVAS